jgi:nitronate monooxygenase
MLNAGSAILARFAPEDADPNAIVRLQRPGLPFFTPAAPARGMPEQWIERSALYAGESALRIDSVVSAAEAVALLTPH